MRQAKRGKGLEEVLALGVRSRREALGLTQKQLAERSGLSPSVIHNVEKASRTTTLKVVAKIGRGLRCRGAELLDEEAAPERPDGGDREWRAFVTLLRGRDEASLRNARKILVAFFTEVERATRPR